MRVLAPALPVRNLTRWVSSSSLALLRHEWSHPSFQPATPIAPLLRLPLLAGQQLEVIVSIEKRWGHAVRPWPASAGQSEWILGLWPEADPEQVLSELRFPER
jgi:endonuclease/exonuclease/phosphatase (EEP) superfamily protein YafD